MNYAIILAGGKGSRMKSDIPKQFLKLNDIPMICYSIEAFELNDNIDRIVVVTSADYIEYMKKIICSHEYKKIIDVVEGGAERYDSVYSGLNCVRKKEKAEGKIKEKTEEMLCCDGDKEKNYVFIHDGARPCVTDNIINSCMQDVKKYNACVAAVPVKDTIKVVDSEGIAVNTPDRSTLWQIQTPQVFETGLILEAYDKLYSDIDKKGITDDAMVIEKYMDAKVKMTLSEYTNIKATTPEDILVTEVFLANKTN